MAEGNSSGGSPSLNLNTLLALLTLAGSVWLVSSKLASDRPVTPAGGSRPFVGEQTLEARLWEDPFKSPDKNSQQGRIPIETNFNSLVEQIRVRSEPPNSVLVLPVMISGGEYSEDQESRIRSRFAIVSALSRSGYAPDDAEHLGAITIPWPTQHEVNQATRTNYTLPKLWGQYSPPATNGHRRRTNLLWPLGVFTSFKMDVHYEWYRRRTFFPRPGTKSVPQNVLVLWLDDSFFEDEPMLRLPLLLESLTDTNSLKTTNAPEVALIGPRRSSTLRVMLPDWKSGTNRLSNATNTKLWPRASDVLRHIKVYCATPSAMDELLVNDPREADKAPRKSVADQLTNTNHNVFFQSFQNFAATDAQLAQEIIGELALRNVKLTNADNHLVLISEWDTFYARMLSLTYGAEMAVTQHIASNRAAFVQAYLDRPTNMPANFHSFVYLRGLDGQTIGGNPNDKAAGDSPAKSPTTSFEELRKWAPDANKAEGQAQFDYLGRLGDQLEELEGRIQRENGRVKIAVGIVGSDVYDTLLILQALRHRFPHFLFFTTDLDARFWHPREMKWSRNLIVASAYGLMLHPDLQGEIAPFRDSTQTAQFAAALAALGNTNLAHLTNIPPRRFEIGNRGPVDLSVKSGLLLATNFPATTNTGPWLHPLTVHEKYVVETSRGNTQAMSWSDTVQLFAGLLNIKEKPDEEKPSDNARNQTLRSTEKPKIKGTRYDPRILSLSGLGLILALTCVFWRPLRERTFGFFRFPTEVLNYRDCDVGGEDGVEPLLTRISNSSSSSDPAGVWLAEEWWKYGAFLPAASNPMHTIPSGATKLVLTATDEYCDLLLRKTEETKAREAQAELDRTLKLRRSEGANGLVQFLNCLLRKKLETPIELKEEVILRQNLLTRWKPHWIMRRWENRRFLDALLDKPTLWEIANEIQLPVPSSAREAARRLFRLRCWNVFGFWVAAVTVATLSWWIGSDMWTDGLQNPAGEPFSLTNGISAWPAILLRLAAVLLSVIFCFTLYSRMRVLFYELTRCYRFPLRSEARARHLGKRALNFLRNFPRHCFPFWHDELSQTGRVSAAELWHRYREGGHPLARILRASVPCVIYFLLASVIYQLFGSPFQPLRGEKGNPIFEWATFKLPLKGYVLTNLSFFFLTFLTIDAARLCRGFIQKLSAGNVEYPDAMREHFRRQRGDVSAEYLDDWIGTRLIADLTERVGKLLWFPGIVFLLLLIARLEWWDHWPWHPAHFIIMTLNFCIALASVVILQRAARAAKRAAEERLTAKVKKLQAQIAPSPAHNDAAQAEKLLEEIQNIRRGAFVPVWENPVLGALMVGPGGLTILQMLIWFMGR